MFTVFELFHWRNPIPSKGEGKESSTLGGCGRKSF
jgi:hypothetical protein